MLAGVEAPGFSSQPLAGEQTGAAGSHVDACAAAAGCRPPVEGLRALTLAEQRNRAGLASDDPRSPAYPRGARARGGGWGAGWVGGGMGWGGGRGSPGGGAW